MHVGIAFGGNVADHHAERGLVETVPEYATAQGGKGIERMRLAYRDCIAFVQPQPVPGTFRQPRFIETQTFAIDLIQRGHDLARANAHGHAHLGSKALRTADRAVGTQKHHGLVHRVNAQTSGLQLRQCGFLTRQTGHPIHDSSTSSRCSTTFTDHPSSSLMPRRSVSEAAASPWFRKQRLGAVLKPRSQRMISSLSACAESVERFWTSARMGMYSPWILTWRAPFTIVAPRVPTAW